MRLKIVVIGLLIAASAGMNAKASGNLSNVQAMFIYNFLRHVNWPEAGGEHFVIGVYGDNDVYQQLQQYTNGRKIGAKTLVLKQISTPTEATACQLVFVADRYTSKIVSIKEAIGNNSTLVVGEREGAIASGSTFEFLLVGNKLKFRVNESRAKEQQLIVSRALLDMAI